MAVTRNTTFTLVDYSDEIELLPKVWSLVSGMNLFEADYIPSTVAQLERVKEISDLFSARKRGGDRNQTGSEDAETKNLNVPFFPLDKTITAGDIQNFREYGSGNESKTLLTQVARVMARIKRQHAQLREKAMAEAIQGRSYLGEGGAGTLYNYYTLWGLTQDTANVDFTDLTTDPAAVLEAQARRVIIRKAQDGSDSNAAYSVVSICGSEWFSAFIAHPLVTEAYAMYASSQEPLRRRLGMGAEENSVRVFKHKGITYIEDLSPNFAEGEAHIFPLAMPDMFKVFYGPMDDAKAANMAGKELYLLYKEDEFNRQYKIESETSILCANTRPELVIKSTGTFA